MKKITAIWICVALCLSLTACGHKHTVDNWDEDAKTHWHTCAECGDQVDSGAHELDEESICTVCGAAVYDEGDGQFCVMTYDEWGSCDSNTYYDADGNITFREYDEREYYEDGNPKHTRTYVDGVLTSERSYLYCENSEFPEVYTSEEINYMDDGSRQVIRYIDWCNVESSVTYNPDGSELESTIYEYDFDDEGNVLGRRAYTNGALSEEAKAFVGPDGNLYDSFIIFYEADGSVSVSNEYVYEFNDNGDQIYHAYYYNGVINMEYFCEADADGWMYTAREVEYDEAGNVISDTSYDSEGNIID